MTDTKTYANTDSCKREPRPQLAAETHSANWRPDYQTQKTALFRLYPTYAVLQHIRTITVEQRTPPMCDLDDAPDLADVPDGVLSELRGAGYDVVAGGRA